MVVVKVEMWPGGDPSRARVLSVATLVLFGQARASDPSVGVKEGERAYVARLFRGVAFGGPDGTQPERLIRPQRRDLWRSGGVRGHFPGPRGEWDLLGATLRALLGDRLSGYVPWPLTGASGESGPGADQGADVSGESSG